MDANRENAIEVTYGDSVRGRFRAGVSLYEVLANFPADSGLRPLAAKVDNAIRSLHSQLTSDACVEPVYLSCEDGERLYWRSLTAVITRAARSLRPEIDVRVEHALSHGMYCELVDEKGSTLSVTEREVRSIESAMKELIEKDEPFEPLEVSASEAASILRGSGREDKAKLIASSLDSSARVRMFRYGDMVDCYYGDLVPSAGYLRLFSLRSYLPGLIMLYPKRYSPHSLPKWEEQRKLSRVFYKSAVSGRTIGVTDLLTLNEAVDAGDVWEIVALTETRQERDLVRIVDEISGNHDRIGLVLIAGPTSSGKTTFAQRLSLHLRLNGIVPHPISMDDYFFERDETPLDECGKPDFESIRAIDLELFNDHLARLVTGDEVSIPTFNFQTGEREYRGRNRGWARTAC